MEKISISMMQLPRDQKTSIENPVHNNSQPEPRYTTQCAGEKRANVAKYDTRDSRDKYPNIYRCFHAVDGTSFIY